MVFRDFRSVSEKHVKAHGKTMKEVQTKLSNIDNDGDYGPKTFEAVVHYQRNHGLKVDGIVGPETLKSLFSEGAHGDTGGTGTQ